MVFDLYSPLTREIKGEESRWVVDIDTYMNYYESEAFMDFINNYVEPFNGNVKCLKWIPTKNGHHLITTPFNLQQFKEKYPDIDVHKNNPTLLYCL